MLEIISPLMLLIGFLSLLNLEFNFFIFVVISYLSCGLDLQRFGIKIKSIGLTINEKVAVLCIIAAISTPFFLLDHRNFLALGFAIASILNMLPIALNNGLMPCLPEAYKDMMGKLSEVDDNGQIVEEGVPEGYCYINERTRLVFLSDIFSLSPLTGVASLGDLLLTIIIVLSFFQQLFFLLRNLLNFILN